MPVKINGCDYFTYLFKRGDGGIPEARGLAVGVELHEGEEQLEVVWERRLSGTVTLTQQAKSRETNLKRKILMIIKLVVI